MKICFIWIKKFRNFENFGFNLSSSTKFSYDPDKNKLTKKDIEELPKDFFGESIRDVVGVIGKNGSGKSNAIELVCKILKGSKSGLPIDFFVIVEDEGFFICYHSFSVKVLPDVNFDISFVEYGLNIDPLRVVFFSNVFDDRRNSLDGEIADISVNNLYNRPSYYMKDRISDFERQINLINSKIFRSLNIEIPTKIQLTSKIWSPRYNTSMERGMYGDYYQRIKDFQKIFRHRVRDIKPENKFIHLFRFGYFFELINSFLRSSIRQNDSRPFFENLNVFLSDLESTRTTEEISEKLIYYLEEEISKLTPEQMTYFDEKGRGNVIEKLDIIKSQLEFIKRIKRSIDNLNLEYNFEGARNRTLEYFTFKYDSKFSKNFINEYIRLFAESIFFEVNWLGISSGHKAYLNLFASLYHELKKAKQTNLLLCIDEGDLYLHPKWQIEFFDKLITVMPSIFSGKAQLILTSHSPFLLSDLPNQCITILDRDFPGSSLNGIDLNAKTFGGNLYDLYSEPFFLGNSRTSDFAYNKIKNLIEMVEGKLVIDQNKKEVLKLTNLIGDEVIQFRIKTLLDDDKNSGALK